MQHRKRGLIALLIFLAVIALDQLLKFWVKTNFYLGEEVEIFPWFRLLFIENNGMAFGMEMGSKLFLTIFRILAVIGLGWYIVWLCRRRGSLRIGYLICVALITAGAFGNIVDCMLYGRLFNDPMPPAVAQFLPAGGGYAPLMMGRVVDMLYFPLVSFTWPTWLPLIGGTEFEFFQPVFNLADAAISVGVIVLVIFYSRYLSDLHGWNEESHSKSPAEEEDSAPENSAAESREEGSQE